MSPHDPNKILLGKILAEVYRMQRKANMPCSATDGQIYGLLNGFETAINEQLERIGYVSEAELMHVIDVLTPYWKEPAKLAEFKGFYDIEHELEAGGVDRAKAIPILRYLYANSQFHEVIAKMDSSDSPSECRTFKLTEWDA